MLRLAYKISIITIEDPIKSFTKKEHTVDQEILPSNVFRLYTAPVAKINYNRTVQIAIKNLAR